MTEFISATLIMLVMAAVLVGGCLAVVIRRERLLLLFERPALTIMGTVLGLFAVGGSFQIIGAFVGESPNVLLVGALLAGMFMMGTVALAVLPWAIERDALTPRPAVNPQGVWLYVAGALIWSCLFLAFAKMVDWITVKESFELKDVSPARLYEYLFVFATVVALAIVEEIIFRGGVQQYVIACTGQAWLGVAVGSLFWALAHGNYVEPYGVKEFHIFVLGLIVGAAGVRHGLRGAIIVHAMNNLASMLLAIAFPT